MTEVIRRQKRYQIDVLIESDRDQEQLAMFIEGVLKQQGWHFRVKELSLNEVLPHGSVLR